MFRHVPNGLAERATVTHGYAVGSVSSVVFPDKQCNVLDFEVDCGFDRLSDSGTAIPWMDSGRHTRSQIHDIGIVRGATVNSYGQCLRRSPG